MSKENREGHHSVCSTTACGVACDPNTYERSPSPYDHSMAHDDSRAVTTGFGDPARGQHMMSGANGGNPYAGEGYYMYPPSDPYTGQPGGSEDPYAWARYDQQMSASSRGVVYQQYPQQQHMGHGSAPGNDQTQPLNPQGQQGYRATDVASSSGSQRKGHKRKGKGKAKEKKHSRRPEGEDESHHGS